MGSVYLGERAAGDLQHLVAIKVIKSGPVSPSLPENRADQRGASTKDVATITGAEKRFRFRRDWASRKLDPLQPGP